MPAPLQMPPMRTVLPPSLNSTAICFDRVSLVMMASAAWAAWPAVEPSRAAASMMPARTLSIGSVTPMRPVEPTRTEPCGKASACSVKRAISRASFRPCLPVQALALPELTTTAWARPFFTRSTQTFTGAAQTWLVVNMPATVAGTSETMSARSRFLPLSEPLPVPRRLMSQKTPAAAKALRGDDGTWDLSQFSFHLSSRRPYPTRIANWPWIYNPFTTFLHFPDISRPPVRVSFPPERRWVDAFESRDLNQTPRMPPRVNQWAMI